jgi:hypothetical protein
MIAIKGTPRLNDKEALEMTRGRVGIPQTHRKVLAVPSAQFLSNQL